MGVVQLLLYFAVPYVILLVVWYIINKKAFNWRPFLFAKYVIANSIHRDLNSKLLYFLLVLWWIFFSTPYLAAIGAAVYIGLNTYYPLIAIIVAMVPSSILTIFLLYMNYNHNGYKIGLSAKILIPISLLLILALNVTIIALQKPQSWRGFGYLFTFPPLLFHAFVICYSRVKIKKVGIEQLLESEVKKNEFVRDISQGNYDNWFEGTGSVKIWLILISCIVSVVMNFLFYAVINTKETFYTALGSLIVDIILFIRQFFVFESQSQTNALLFLDYVLKIIVISLGPDYWLLGHGIYFFVFSSVYLIRFLHWLLIITICNGQSDEKVPQIKLKDLSKNARKTLTGSGPLAHIKSSQEQFNDDIKKLKPGSRRPPTIEAIASAVAFALVVVCISFELKFSSDFAPELVFGQNQKDIFIAIFALTIFVSLCLSSLICSYNNHGKITIPMLIAFIAAFLLDGFFFGFYDQLNFSPYIRGSIFMVSFLICACLLLFILILGNKFSFKKDSPNFWSIIVVAILIFIDTVCLIVVPIVLEDSFIGLLISLCVFTFVTYLIFLYYFTSLETAKYWIISLLVSICFLGGVGGTLYAYLKDTHEMEDIIFIILAVVLVIIFVALYVLAFVWTRLNSMRFTIGPLLITFFVSLIIACILSYLYYRDDYNSLLYPIFVFVFVLIMFGSIMLYSFQKEKWKPSCLSITAFVLFIIFALAIGGAIIYFYRLEDENFTIYTAATLIVAVICLVGTFVYTLMNNKTQVLVFTNLFFPVRRYVNGTIAKIKSFTVMFALLVLVIWIWGLIGASLDDQRDYCLLAINGIWVLACFIIIFLLMDLDGKALTAIQYMSADTINFAVTKAMRSANVSILFNLPPKNRTSYEKFIKYEKEAHKMWASQSAFMSCLKAQLYISAEMAFTNARNRLKQYLQRQNFNTEYLDLNMYSIEDRNNIISLWLRINGRVDAGRVPDNNNDTPTPAPSPTPAKPGQRSNVVAHETSVSAESVKIAKHQRELISKSIEVKQRYNNLLASSTTSFVDSEFHPGKKISESNSVILSGVKWERAEKKFKAPIFGRTTIDDIVQGSLGDCYFVASMNALRMDDAEKILWNAAEGAKKGAACARFFSMGQEVYVTVDTQIPFKNDKARMVSPRDYEHSPWWFVMVEKAFSKFIGSYSSVIGGTADVAFYRLVGGWCSVYKFSDLDVGELIENGELWDTMLRLHQNGHYLVAASHPGSDRNKNKDNIVQGHAYCILRVVDTHGVQLLQMRNPWGEGEWTGDWSDDSKLWKRYPAIAKAVNFHPNPSDGLFWISFKDFVYNYASLYTCMRVTRSVYRTDIHDKLLPGKNDGAKPTKGAPDADTLPQYLIRFNGQTTLRLSLERVGPDLPVWVYMVWNEGNPVQKIQAGTTHKSEPIPPNKCLHSFEWVIDGKAAKPWTIFVCRNKCKEEMDYMLTIYSDKSIEVSKLVNCDNGKIVQK